MDIGHRFPVQRNLSWRWLHPTWASWIPWAIAELCWERYATIREFGPEGASMLRIGDGGGFTPQEIDALLCNDYSPRGVRKREGEEFLRASGNVLCEACGLPYQDHPMSPHYLSYDKSPFLNRICDGRLLKL